MPREWVEATANVQQWSEFEMVGELYRNKGQEGIHCYCMLLGWPFSCFGSERIIYQ